MVTPRAGALCAALMFQGLRLPLSRGFCTASLRQGGALGKTALSVSRIDVTRCPKTRGVSRRHVGGARLCMNTEASSVTEKPQAEDRTMEEEVDPGEVEGTDLRVLKYPHPALRAENEEIEAFDDDLKKLAKDMFKVMYASKGVGLAAPQVGVNKRLMVFNPEGDPRNWLDEAVLVNPRIVATGKGKVIDEEGCLSFPGMRGNVERNNWVKVEAQNAKGKKIKKKYTDWTARIFQHEYDHLDGTVYIDHLTSEGRKKVQPVLDKLISDFGEGAAL